MDFAINRDGGFGKETNNAWWWVLVVGVETNNAGGGFDGSAYATPSRSPSPSP